MKRKAFKGLLAAAAVFAGLGALYGVRLLQRPSRIPVVRSLFQGITYERHVRDIPRPIIFHVVEIDLTAPGINFLVTPSRANDDQREFAADTVPGFVERHGVQVAVNGSYFFPQKVPVPPLIYFPRVGEGADTMGVSISGGDRHSEAEEGWAALCIISVRDIQITPQDCPPETQHGIAGDIQFVKDGAPYTDGLVLLKNSTRLMPRSAIALNKDTTKLWMVVLDGRQIGYSEGVTLAELGEILIELGADRALNLDGGGSSTLATDAEGAAQILNAPFQARVPMKLRPVANHLGVYALPLSDAVSDTGTHDAKETAMSDNHDGDSRHSH